MEADILPIEYSKARSQLGRFLTDHCALTLKVKWPESDPAIANITSD
jgi:hypothetical protein